MGDEVAKSAVRSKPTEYKFTSIKSPEYRREFINGAFSNVTPRGEIVCEFHFESRDMPSEQVAKLVSEGSGEATLSALEDPRTYTRDVKFGIVMNVPFAQDLVILLNQKIKEAEAAAAGRAKRGGKP